MTTIGKEQWLLATNPDLTGFHSEFDVDISASGLSAACRYRLEFTISETRHADPQVIESQAQLQERGFLEGINSSTGEVTFRTRPTDDVPECSAPAPVAGTPEYTACTQETVTIDDFAPSADTDLIVIRHLDYWEDSFIATGDTTTCPSGSPNDACSAQVFIDDQWHSFHGVEIRITPIE